MSDRTGSIRGRLLSLLVLAGASGALVGGTPGAAAQGEKPLQPVAGKYAARFQQVANNCSGMGMSLGSAAVELFQGKERAVQVTIPAVPIMRGVGGRAGKFKAEARRGKTAIQGVDGRFSIAGRVDQKGIQFLFIAEYYRGKKPLCTQSWNGSGPRS